ncbi:MAG: peptidylprolyl isomerase [bacterium]
MSWLRKHSKLLIWITAIAFIVPFIAGTLIRNFMGPQGPRGVLAVVNGQQISLEEFQNQFDLLRERRNRNRDQPLTPDKLDSVRQEAFKQIVNKTLMQELLKEEGAGATEREIRRTFFQNPTFIQEDGSIDRQAVQTALRRMPEERRTKIERNTRQRIESVRMSQWLASQVTTPDTETGILMREGLRELNLYGIFIDPRTFIKQERISDYYNSNKEDYREPPKAFVRHILFKADTATQRRRTKLNEIKRKIQTIRRRFKAGDQFEELARQFSEDTPTARRGGSLGWVQPDDLDQNMANKVFSGDTRTLSGLIRSDSGYHIAYVEKGPKTTYKSLSEVEDKIRDRLLSDTHWSQARRKVKSLRSRINGSSNPLQTLQELALVYSHSKFASDRAGHYGWVPTSFVLDKLHTEASQWGEELLQQNQIRQEISAELAQLKAKSVSDIVKSPVGFHIFMAEQIRSPELDNLSDTDTGKIRTQLARQKKQNYQTAWLRQKRQEATIELKVSKSRIGGSIPWKTTEE